MPLITRCVQRLRRLVLRLWGYESPSQYVCRRGQVSLGTGYILTEYIDPSRGKLLSETWTDGRHNAGMRTNLFHGLSRIILSLARTPLPKIGSFVIDEKGYLRLSNRPLTLQIQQLENEQIPVDIPRGITYSTVDSYVNDILAIHESRLRHQPNAIHDLRDGLYQTSALTLMRSVWSCYFRRDFLRGPFSLSLTDLHPRNIFVDDDWNIKCLIDLEWACTRPVEMIHPPFWLSNQAIDLISLDDYENLHNEFMEAFEKEEARITPGSGPSFRLYPVLQQGWKRGTFWCSLALNSPTALFKIFFDHIQPRFSKTNLDDASFWTITMSYWTFDTLEFIKEKMEDNENYDRSLREAFES